MGKRRLVFEKIMGGKGKPRGRQHVFTSLSFGISLSFCWGSML